jgi:hypothetical protein
MTNEDLEELIIKQAERIDRLERITLPLIPMGPQEPTAAQEAEKARAIQKAISSIKEKIESAKEPPPPTDFDARVLADGSPVPEDESHKELRPDGQQKAYVVLTETERSKGFIRPYRDAYRHLKCGHITTMGRAIAETYAREPHFYSGTFCTTCGGHFPVGKDGEFVWYEMDGTTGPKVGT